MAAEPEDGSGCRLPMAPPTASMSLASKLAGLMASLKVKVMLSAPVTVLVAPLVRVTMTVGAVVSVLKGALMRLLASKVAPVGAGLVPVSRLVLPPASLKVLLATLMVALPLALAVGVKVTVYWV